MENLSQHWLEYCNYLKDKITSLRNKLEEKTQLAEGFHREMERAQIKYHESYMELEKIKDNMSACHVCYLPFTDKSKYYCENCFMYWFEKAQDNSSRNIFQYNRIH